MRRLLVLLATLLAVPSLAGGVELAADDRAQVEPDAHQADDRAGVGVRGHLGAFGFDSGVEGDASPDDGESYLTVTNPPSSASTGTGGSELEETFGPPVARAALGTGGLTAGFTGTGVLSNLAWPGPGFYDHVNYVNVTRGWRNHGAPENGGSFGGLILPGEGGTWLTAADGWEVVEQRYESERSGVLRTVLHRDGISVTIRDVVHPDLDVLARRFTIEGAEGASLAYYANMNPTTTRTPKAPSTTDAALDNASDFGTVFDAARGVMVHFRPLQVDPAAASVAATGRLGEENATAALDGTFGTGAYVAVGGDEQPTEHQAGLDAAGLMRDEAEGTPLLDPFYDARDGGLSGSPAAFGKTAGALRWSRATGTVYVTAADSASAAAALIDEARALRFNGIRSAADADWRQWLRDARLPQVDDAAVRAATVRALMLIRTAQDRRTGAIVANTTTQTPYRQDWLRDGAFFNYALLVAGYTDMVADHNAFYRRAQSETGHWDPILCTDGAHCDAAFPFEIDAQALGVWSLWLEYEFDPRPEVLDKNWEAIRKGAEVLWACQDRTNGMQCYAAEDDSVRPTQFKQGAATVYLGLMSAAKAARHRGEHAVAERWEARAEELREAARTGLCREGPKERPNCGARQGRGSIYLVWPSRLLIDAADPALQPTLDLMAAQLERRMTFSAPEPGGFFQYPMEPILALATAWQGAAAPDLLPEAIRWLAHDVAEPGVHHYAERIFHLGGGEYLHTVGFPHVWSGAEMYIAAALVHGVGGCPNGEHVGDVTCTGGAGAG